MKKLSVIDFFCGAGGFSEGFRQKGFKILEGYDNWQPAIDTFNHNFNTNSTVKNILDFKESIEEINLLPDTDVIIGSPPCVSFSSSNISGKADKESGVILTKIFLRIVAVKKFQKNSILKAWYMENVANSRNYLADYYTFNDLGLGLWAKTNKLSPNKKAIILKDNQPLINSADYGSYQARKRAISGEIISKEKLIIPKPTNSDNKDSKLPKWNNLGALLNNFPSPILEYSETLIQDPIYKSIKIKIEELTDHFYDSGLYKSEWRQSREHKTNHYCMGKMAFPENKDKPSRTITATKSGTSREALIYKSEYPRKGNGEYRSPTVREAASIMGFPFTYQFLGSPNNKWRLVGNAVCPSVSRTFANELLIQLGINNTDDLELVLIPKIDGVENLNSFKENDFKKQPKRVKNSRFRRHPLKVGNLTVTLSNFDIEKNGTTSNKWYTSIQYGTGEGYKNQKIDDDYYKELETIISKLESGKQFIKIINNGFSEKIGNAFQLQEMYEIQKSVDSFFEPTVLVEEVKSIIDKVGVKDNQFMQKEIIVFKEKKIVPTKQLFALYAINKIATIANSK
ncbi:MAG: DNA cytosine methyltransferase [Bacteroidota bacterium]